MECRRKCLQLKDASLRAQYANRSAVRVFYQVWASP